MKFRDYIYIICMIFFIVLAYLFFDRGFNVRTKEIVKYQENSDITYRVYLHKNDEFSKEYLKMGERYITSLVDRINFDFKYSSIFSKNVSGYYSYSVVGTLHAYLDNINESIWEKDYTILDNKTVVLNENDLKNIDILDRAVVDYDKYSEELSNFSKKYGLDLSGYLEVNVVKGKNLTNTRSAGKDHTVVLKKTRPITLEDALEYINTDELVEVTPENFRMRKRILNTEERKKFDAREKNK